MVKFAFNACKIVVIVVDTLWRGKVLLLDVNCGITDAITFGPLLMTFDAREGAGQGGAARAAVIVWFDMAVETFD